MFERERETEDQKREVRKVQWRGSETNLGKERESENKERGEIERK